MSFIWEEESSKGSIINFSVLKEVTDNIDHVDDNQECISHNSNRMSTHNVTFRTEHYIGNDTTHMSSDLANPHHAHHDVTHLNAQQATHHIGVLTGHYVSVHCATHYDNRQNAPHHTSDRNAPHYTTVYYTHLSSHLVTHDTFYK